MADVFISYAREDQQRIAQLAEALRRHGCTVFTDRRIPAGRTWADFIGNELNNARCVVVVWSKASVASRFVKLEASRALERRHLVPVRIEAIEPPFEFSDLHAADLTTWTGDSNSDDFLNLLADINTYLEESPAPVKLESTREPLPISSPAERTREPHQAYEIQTGVSTVASSGSGVNRRSPHPRSFTNPMEEGAEYVLIPAGAFQYSVTKKLTEIPPLYFAKYPVTNRLYRRFLKYLAGSGPPELTVVPVEVFADSLVGVANQEMLDAIGRKHRRWVESMAPQERDERFQGDTQPVVGISWHAAVAYCHWLTLLSRASRLNNMVFRLPKDAEWEWAAGGGKRLYPWGESEPTEKHANYGQVVPHPMPVDAHPDGATPEGLMSMAGNVEEWVDERFDYSCMVTRGGGWTSRSKFDLCCDERDRYVPSGLFHVGFRVVGEILSEPC